MKIFVIFLVLLVVVLAIVGPQTLYTVDEKQMAVVTRFGEPVATNRTPGLKVKAPFVDTVNYFDKRLLLFDAPPDSLLTLDKKRLIIDVYARGRIIEPLVFFEKLRTEAQAASRAVDIISSELRSEVAGDIQAEIITTKREAIMAQVKANVFPKLLEFGIELVDLRIKRADFPNEIADSVYARMQAERKRIGDRERAEGAEVDARVRADVDKQATVIRALAQRDADITRGCGEAEAVKIFADAFKEDPEFFTFEESLRVNRDILTQNTTAIMTVSDLGQLFEGIRRGAVLGAQVPEGAVQGAGSDLDQFGSRCAEVAATRTLARNLNLDLALLEVISAEAVQWPNSSLGCPEEGRAYAPITVSGYSVVLDQKGERYEIHTNQHGSAIAICDE
jgi:membrane protease subunit HflC